MPGSRRARVALIVLITAAFLSIAGISCASAGPARTGGAVRVAIIGEPPTLDLHMSTAGIVELTVNMYETLFTYDGRYRAVPLLASGHRWENNNRRLVVFLRQGVLFHNGKEMTSEDVVASLGRWFEVSALGRTLKPKVASIRADGKYTVVIDLREPVGNLIEYLAQWNNGPSIHPKETIDEVGSKPLKRYIGTGPFKLAEWRPDRWVKMVRWEQYRSPEGEPSGLAGRREVYIDELYFLPVPDSTSRLAGVETGEYDVAIDVPQDQYTRVTSSPDVEAVIKQPYGWPAVVFNKKQGMFTDLRLRQAFHYSVDPEPALRAAIGHPAFYRLDPSLMPKESVWWSNEGSDVYNRRDVARARQLMEQAGYDGRPIRWLTTQEYDWNYRLALVVKEQLEEVGWKVDLQVVDWATLLDRRRDPSLWDIFATRMLFSPEPVAANPYLSASWPGWYVSDAAQQLLSALNRESDFEARLAIWNKIQRLVYQDFPVFRFGDTFSLTVKRRALKGFVNFSPVAGFYWNTWLSR